MAGYSLEVIAAAGRIARTFADGCDRCDMEDLDLLESVGLMSQGIVEEPSDTLQQGDTAWFFTAKGQALSDAILNRQ